MLKQIRYLFPFSLIFGLFSLLYWELSNQNTSLPSALLGKSIPDFHLKELHDEKKIFSQKDLLGQVSLLNVWATWCYACRVEHPMLLKIKETYHIPIYSIVYKDNSSEAKNWLSLNGNPYTLTGNDITGDVAIDLGVYGTPETFIISPVGEIIYRHVGVIDENIWNNVLFPLIKQYSK